MNDNLIYWIVLALAVFVVFVLQNRPAPPPLSAETFTGKARHIVDGDTLYIRGHKPAIRLWGVDAPERDKRGFNDATAHLKNLAHGKRLECRKIDIDRYGRTVARCFLQDGREINAEMIASGTAKEYRQFSKGFYSKH